MHRTIRWVDRCLSANERSHDQALFPIVQGGLDEDMRKQCAAGMTCVKMTIQNFCQSLIYLSLCDF